MATDTMSNLPDIINARILVVDDNPGTAETLARAISRMSPNLQVLSADSAEAALKKLNGGAVDLIVTDMMMPGMNGLELIDRLRQRSPGNRFYSVLITAYDVPGLRESARRMKVNDVLVKPFSPERICQIVRRALERSQPLPVLPGQHGEITPKFKILAVDDNPSNLALLLRYLQQEEYQILTASNGVEALQLLQAEPFDLLLLDVNMPEMDGFQVLEKMRSTPSLEHIPVIIITAARLDPVDMQYAMNAGADDYVTKPFDRRELLSRIRSRLRVKRSEDALRRRNRELNLLPEIGRELSARNNIHDLADIILKRTVETLGAFMGHLVLLEQQGMMHQTEIVSSAKRDDFTPQLPDLAPILAQLNETRQGMVISDTRIDKRWPVSPGDLSRSVMIAPIFGRFGLLGLLALAHEQPGYFSQEHVFLLQAIASQAAIAVENARLFATMKQEQQRLQAVLQNTTDAVLIFDSKRKISLVNAAAQKLFRDIATEIEQPLQSGAKDNPLVGLLEKAHIANTPQACMVNWPDKRTVNLCVTPIEDGYVATVHDISSRG